MVDFNQFDTSNLPVEIGTIIQLAFFFVLGAYAIFSIVLYYHWIAYSTNAKVTGLTLILYFSSTIPLLIAMGAMTFII